MDYKQGRQQSNPNPNPKFDTPFNQMMKATNSTGQTSTKHMKGSEQHC